MAEAFHQNYGARHQTDSYIVQNDAPKLVRLKQRFPALYQTEGLLSADAATFSNNSNCQPLVLRLHLRLSGYAPLQRSHAMVRAVTDLSLDTARAFLETHIETSLFLLSNLATLGPRLGDALNSGNCRCIEEYGRVVAVFSLARRGTLLAETGGRDDLADEILLACESDPIRIEGVIGEWTAADSLWVRLCADPLFRPTYASKELLYRLALPIDPVPRPLDARVRDLGAADFERWEPLSAAFLTEEGLPIQGTIEQRRDNFARHASEGQWWGAFDGPRLLAMAALNATYGEVGQVGGVYTVPEKRRKGLSRSVMGALVRDASGRHQLKKLILFTGVGDKSAAARHLYESMGFSRIGFFGLLFGSWAGMPT